MMSRVDRPTVRHLALCPDANAPAGFAVWDADRRTNIGRMPDDARMPGVRRLSLHHMGALIPWTALGNTTGLHTLECYGTPIEPEDLPPRITTLVSGSQPAHGSGIRRPMPRPRNLGTLYWPAGLVRLRLDWCGYSDRWDFLSAMPNLAEVWINHSGLRPDEDPGADLAGG